MNSSKILTEDEIIDFVLGTTCSDETVKVMEEVKNHCKKDHSIDTDKYTELSEKLKTVLLAMQDEYNCRSVPLAIAYGVFLSSLIQFYLKGTIESFKIEDSQYGKSN